LLHGDEPKKGVKDLWDYVSQLDVVKDESSIANNETKTHLFTLTAIRGHAYLQLVYIIPQILNTSFRLITSTINAPQNPGILVQANPIVRSPDPFFVTTKNGKKQSGHTRLC